MEAKNRSGIFVFIILLALMAVYYTFYIKKTGLTLSEKAQERAMLLGRQLIDREFVVKVYLPEEKNKRPTAERDLASQSDEVMEMTKKVMDGEIGRDPWGRPFYFQVKGDGKAGSKLYIWSYGENGKPDFKTSEDLIKNGAPWGDDVLTTITI